MKNRPFTFMLVAASLDGKISPRRRPGQANPVGPELIDDDIMRLHNSKRAGVDAVMVGLNCILLDDARLTLREGEGRSPIRVVLDGLAEMPPAARILDRDAPTVVVVSKDAPPGRVRTLRDKGADVITSGRGRFVDLAPAMEELWGRFGVSRLMVEGGGTVHRSMISSGLYDEVHLIICPFVIGGSRSITPVDRWPFWPRGPIPRYSLAESQVIGDYIYVVYRPIEA
ncbi:MAG: dihydrofolate reductase family protein [bacterium]|nr:MAG: dihydrofolate reductase family protein [bacterium]